MSKNTKKNIKIGSWITSYNPAVVEVMSRSKFSWLAIDLEHTTITLSEAENLIQIIKINKCIPYVRVGSNNELIIKKVLDSGAMGIIVPNIKNKEDVLNAIKYSKYPPIGARGVGLARAQNYGLTFNKYMKDSKKIKLIVQIENKQALDSLDEILKIKDLDGTFIGPYDLSASLGVLGKLTNPKVISAIKKYEKKSKEYKMPMGFHAVNLNPNDLKNKIKLGYKYLAYGTDMIYLESSCKNELNKIF